MNTKRNTMIAPLSMILLTIAMGGYLIVQKPQATLAFLIAMFALPFFWFLIERKRFRGDLNPRQLEDREMIRYSITGAGLMLVVPLALTILFTSGIDWITDEMEQRTMGIVFGLVFAAYGNAMPKRPVSLSEDGDAPAKTQAFNRFSGLMFVLTGLAYVLAWIFIPISIALPAAMTVLVLGIGFVIVRAARLKMKLY